MAPRRQKTAVEPSAWLEQARHIADFGDRWLVSLGHSVSRLGRWAEAEADSAIGANPGSAPKLRRRNSPSSSQRERRQSKSDRTRSERPSMGLVSATPAEPAEHTLCAGGAENAPGVLPLVQALGRVVADHQDGSYATLAADERLWTLVDLLQVLARRPRPASEAAAATDGPQVPPIREY